MNNEEALNKVASDIQSILEYRDVTYDDVRNELGYSTCYDEMGCTVIYRCQNGVYGVLNKIEDLFATDNLDIFHFGTIAISKTIALKEVFDDTIFDITDSKQRLRIAEIESKIQYLEDCANACLSFGDKFSYDMTKHVANKIRRMLNSYYIYCERGE